MKFRQIIFIGIFIGMLTSIAGAAISRTQALEGFVTAEAFYKQGEFAQAASAYEEILTAGGESGAIYYNLGNTYYKMGELGKAMLNYEKARQLIPRDSDLNFNYHYLRSKLGLTDPAVSMNFLQKLIYYHIHFYSLEEMVWIVFLFTVIIGGIYLMALYWKWSLMMQRISLAIFVCLWMVFTIGIIFKVSDTKNTAVVLENTDARFEPIADSTTHYRLSWGEKVKVLSAEDQWMKVKRSDGKSGWIPRENAKW